MMIANRSLLKSKTDSEGRSEKLHQDNVWEHYYWVSMWLVPPECLIISYLPHAHRRTSDNIRERESNVHHVVHRTNRGVIYKRSVNRRYIAWVFYRTTKYTILLSNTTHVRY